jgi:hypothetical protein
MVVTAGPANRRLLDLGLTLCEKGIKIIFWRLGSLSLTMNAVAMRCVFAEEVPNGIEPNGWDRYRHPRRARRMMRR